jgi:hypothetical protein
MVLGEWRAGGKPHLLARRRDGQEDRAAATPRLARGGRRCSGATVPLPEVDVREDTNAIVVEVELPGVEAALGEVVVLALVLLLVLLLALDGHHAIGERH